MVVGVACELTCLVLTRIGGICNIAFYIVIAAVVHTILFTGIFIDVVAGIACIKNAFAVGACSGYPVVNGCGTYCVVVSAVIHVIGFTFGHTLIGIGVIICYAFRWNAFACGAVARFPTFIL